jgi:hypothetical protein
MDSYDMLRIQKHVKQLIKRKMLADKRIVLFGASRFSKDILACLEEHGYSADAVIDNDSRKTGNRFLGMIVQKPEDALVSFNDKTIILFYSPGFYWEITAQLEKMGYKRNRHIFSMNLKIDNSLHIFAYLTATKIRGLHWYRKIMRGHTKDCKVFIAPYTGTGDIYLIGLFFNEYIRRNGITDYVFTVVSNACKKVADMFDIKNIIVLPPQVSDDIISLKHVNGGEHLNIITLNDGWLGDPLQWLRGYKELNFEKMFRYFVFGFDDSVPHELPTPKDFGSEIDELFKKHELIKGKTVVLSPYSNTLFGLPDDVFGTIVSYCQERGMTVCTNCAGSEKPIKGTKAVFFPLNQAIAFFDAAGYFIGVRSGLCDIISSSRCKKVIFYEKDGLFYKTSHFEYFSLNKMKLCDEAVEIEYSDALKDACLREVLRVFDNIP